MWKLLTLSVLVSAQLPGADHKWISPVQDPPAGTRRSANVPPSHKIPLNVTSVYGCGYNSDGTVFVSSYNTVTHVDRQGTVLSSTTLEAGIEYASVNLKHFMTRSEEGEYKVLKNGVITTLPKTAFPGKDKYSQIYISPDGNMYVAALEKRDGREIPEASRQDYYGVFNAQGNSVRTLNVPQNAKLATFSPDGKSILGELSRPPRLFSIALETGSLTYLTPLNDSLRADISKETLRPPYNNNFSGLVAFSNDGNKLAISTNRLLVVDLKKQALKFVERSVLNGYELPPSSLGFGPDGTLSLSLDDPNAKTRRVQLINSENPSERATLDIPLPRGAYLCSAFHPNGQSFFVVEGTTDDDGGNAKYWVREFQIPQLFGK